MVVEMQMMKEMMDFMKNALRGWVSNDLDELALYCTHHFIPPSTKVSYAVDRSL